VDRKSIHGALDDFFTARIGVRVLIGDDDSLGPGGPPLTPLAWRF
jgi:hypothetical protein